MTFTLEHVPDSPMDDEWVLAPFQPSELFTLEGWTGPAKGPVEWCRFVDAGDEVARAKVVLSSEEGHDHPSRPVPAGGATELALVEVRKDLRGKGIGRKVIEVLTGGYTARFVLISLDSDSDEFWRNLGWTEHPHRVKGKRNLFELP